MNGHLEYPETGRHKERRVPQAITENSHRQTQRIETDKCREFLETDTEHPTLINLKSLQTNTANL